MFSTNFENILGVISFITSCMVGCSVAFMLKELFDKIDAKFTQFKTDKKRLEEENEGLKVLNEEYRMDNEDLKRENEELLARIDALNFDIETRYDTVDEELMKENTKLAIRCEILEQKLEKIKNKAKRVSKPTKSYNQEYKECYQDENENTSYAF